MNKPTIGNSGIHDKILLSGILDYLKSFFFMFTLFRKLLSPGFDGKNIRFSQIVTLPPLSVGHTPEK